MINIKKCSLLLMYAIAIFALIFFVWLEYTEIAELTNNITVHSLNRDLIFELSTGPQKLFFVQSICFALLLSLFKTKYCEPVIAIRYKDNILLSIITKGILLGFLYSLYVILVYIIITKYSGNIVTWNFHTEFVKLFFFCLYCYSVYQLAYFASKSFYIPPILIILGNFLIISIAVSLDYYGSNSNFYTMLGSIAFLLPLSFFLLFITCLFVRKKNYI